MMSSKWGAALSAGEMKAKRSRKSLSFENKLEIVKCHKGGEGGNYIVRTLQLPQFTVSTIIKQVASVKKAVM
ncbi:hypothetical protein E2C01_026534 [Portunus trituberculatus]|uniref:HTH psq-type domain-containing protein n=1 Tax=Portunus trituberculatus TaxID=210409 RepID=A0A5B7EFV1_PORTR|nr:hypothetical protein [Portunus trituberculatus]